MENFLVSYQVHQEQVLLDRAGKGFITAGYASSIRNKNF